MMNRLILPAARIAAAIAVVVVPFGYAITGNHGDVLMVTGVFVEGRGHSGLSLGW